MPSSIWRPDSGNRRRHLALWAGLIGPPVLWLTLLETDYLLAYAACSSQQTWFLYVAIAASCALAATAGFAGWRMGPPEDRDERSAPWTVRTREIRARWMSVSAVALTLWFLIVMLAMAIPVVVLRACD